VAQRLLVGFDGSPGTCAALRHAAGLAASEHGTLTIVTVLGRSYLATYAWCAPVAPAPDREDGADICLRKAVRDLPERVSVTWLIRHGDAAEVLAEVAEQRGCDAIVVARRRLAWRLRRLTTVPVIAVRRPRRRPPRRSGARPATASATRARTAI
jgi:nucleotide-binding universal stress UspA family protein